jgi:hypothetical protein
VRATKPRTGQQREGRLRGAIRLRWGKTALKKVGRIRTFGIYTASLICHHVFLNKKRVGDAQLRPTRGNRFPFPVPPTNYFTVLSPLPLFRCLVRPRPSWAQIRWDVRCVALRPSGVDFPRHFTFYVSAVRINEILMIGTMFGTAVRVKPRQSTTVQSLSWDPDLLER